MSKLIPASFSEAVIEARKPCELEAAGNYRMISVAGIPDVEKTPVSLVILLENVIRRAPTDELATEAAWKIISAAKESRQGSEIEFMPARVLFQDFTGVPVFVDFAAMRDAVLERGGDPATVNPRIPCALVIDHSVTADEVGPGACEANLKIESDRNHERFAFLKWASKSFDKVAIVPPGKGICHQLNIERFCQVVTHDELSEDKELLCFDTLIGTDSHTTTANGIGVLGWGVGGIEAEAAALGQPVSMLVPEVVGLELTGKLNDQASGMDVALNIAKLLRSVGVVGKIVEVFGEGLASLSATQRACIANMTPEYGATSVFFAADEEVLRYMETSGRDSEQLRVVRAYLEQQGVFGTPKGRSYAQTLELDLSKISWSIAGPSRPHDLLALDQVPARFAAQAKEHGRIDGQTFDFTDQEGNQHQLGHGTIALAAVTSCTTATDPAMMIAAGLLAKAAVERGLQPKPWVKKVFAPGSHATENLLKRAGLLSYLEELGFYTCGFGCMSCIGNSGDVFEGLRQKSADFEYASVLSGNRNFEGRISPDVEQNFLCQPALVVAYSLLGSVGINIAKEPLGKDSSAKEVYLKDIMPSSAEIQSYLEQVVSADLYAAEKDDLFVGDEIWQSIEAPTGVVYNWDNNSTYIRRAPYFDLAQKQDEISLSQAEILVYLGDFVTTDHISPAGKIAPDNAAAAYLREHGVSDSDFNTYGARRGNHEVMQRGTFANIRVANKRTPLKFGGWARNCSSEITTMYEASEDFKQKGRDLVVLAGKMYGSGSSRDWAAKGPLLLGIKAVIAESFERIHRSNLVGMGILPLELVDDTLETLGLSGDEQISVEAIRLSSILADQFVEIKALAQDGHERCFKAKVRIDTPTEIAYMRSGGILPYVLDQLV